MRTFFRFAKDQSPQSSAARIRDELLGEEGIKRDTTLETALRWLARFCKEALSMGAYRLPTVVYDSSRPLIHLGKPNNWLGGANISLRYETLLESLPYPAMTWRGEDVTWSRLMSKLYPGGIYRANLPVGHLRHAGQGRNVLKEFGQDLGYYISEQLIDSLVPNSRMGRAELAQKIMKVKAADALTYREGIVKKQDAKKDYAYFSHWKGIVEETKNLLELPQWWSADKHVISRKRIVDFLDYFGKEDLVQELVQFTPSPEELEKSIKNYGLRIQQWPTLVRTLLSIKSARSH